MFQPSSMTINIQSEVMESVPKPGSTGHLPNLSNHIFIRTEYMTKDDIIKRYPVALRIKDEVMPDTLETERYYEYTLELLRAGVKTNARANKVLEYSNYLKKYPMSRLKLPPILIINNKFADGTHRISAIHLLENLLDTQNPVWCNCKLKVNFYKNK